MRNIINEFFKPIFQNGEEITPQKWINSFLFLVGVQFIWFIIEIITSFDLNDSFELTIAILVLLYITIMCLLIFRKQKWGWILLFWEKLLTGSVCIISLVVVMSSDYFGQEEVGELFWGIIISLLFIGYLIKEEVYSYFKISKDNKAKYLKRISLSVVIICTIGIIMFYANSY